MLQRVFNPLSLVDRCRLALDILYPMPSDRHGFADRFKDFTASDPSLPHITEAQPGVLRYESESFVPPRLDPVKPNLYCVVGNPAPRSVALRAMYAHEGDGDNRQHRFWKVMHSTRVLRFTADSPDSLQPAEKMRRLHQGEYVSPFNLHIIPFFSLPSPPTGPWSGIAGLRRLFGRRFRHVMAAELGAVRGLIDKSMRPGDCVLVFQKDAYTALKSSEAPAYDVRLLRIRPIGAHYADTVDLICLPPTRLLYSRVTQAALAEQVAKATACAALRS